MKKEEGLKNKFKNLIFKKSIPICEVVDDVLGKIKNQNLSNLNVYDPSATGLFFSEISKVIVYVNGGITYSELKALKEIEKSYKIPFLCGGCEILNSEEFLNQIEKRMNEN